MSPSELLRSYGGYFAIQRVKDYTHSATAVLQEYILAWDMLSYASLKSSKCISTVAELFAKKVFQQPDHLISFLRFFWDQLVLWKKKMSSKSTLVHIHTTPALHRPINSYFRRQPGLEPRASGPITCLENILEHWSHALTADNTGCISQI